MAERVDKIPRHIVERHKEGVEQLKFYGHSVLELDRDELLAMVNCLALSLKEERERVLANIEMSASTLTRYWIASMKLRS